MLHYTTLPELSVLAYLMSRICCEDIKMRLYKNHKNPCFPSTMCRTTLCIILTAIMLSACQDPYQNAHSGGPTAVETDDFQAAIFYYDYTDVYLSSVRTALIKELAALGIAYNEYDAEASQATQDTQIETAIRSHADVLVVNIVSSGSSGVADNICLKAERAGIPVIFFNRSIEADGDEGVILDYYNNVAFVGTDPAEAGHLQGQMIGDYVSRHFKEMDLNDNGEISYAMFKGEAKNAEAIYRTKYSVEDANDILTSAGMPKLVYFNLKSVDAFQLDLTGKWSLTAAQDYMMADLSQYNRDNDNMIELVICNNDNMAEGCVRALQTVGYNLPKEESTVIPVFGVDATAAAKKLIEDGAMTGTVVQDADGMAKAISQLVNNVYEKRELLDGMQDYAYDKEHDLKNKIYIPYHLYDPKQNPQNDGEESR